MPIPDHLWRCPTAAAVDSLATRFGLPNTPSMQDWQWHVADSDRIGEFLAAYQSGELSDDERFTLMETIMQSFEDLSGPIGAHPLWHRTLALLDSNISLHIYTVWYWSLVDHRDDEMDLAWRVTPFIREILRKHRDFYEKAENSPKW